MAGIRSPPRAAAYTAPVAVPIHLHPTAALAERVLLPGDPGRALLLAQTVLEAPAMFNHHRGLWGYTGTASDGEPLTIQSTGMGGPSAAIVITELAELGARRLVRVGTCRAMDPSGALGDLVIVTEAIPHDGASRALGAVGPLRPDATLLEGLRGAGTALPEAGANQIRAGRVLSSDLFYDGGEMDGSDPGGAIAIEMCTATLFAIATHRQLQAASLLLVTDLRVPSGSRITEDALRAGEESLGTVAAGALMRAAPATAPRA